MSRRQRHFNARDAGASLVMDTRFLPGYAATDPISTFTARHGSNATATTTARPTYEVGGPGGNPVARFASPNLMTITTPVSAAAPLSCLMTYKRRTTGVYMMPLGGDTFGQLPYPAAEWTDDNTYIGSPDYIWTVGSSTSSWVIASSIFSASSAVAFYRSGVSVSVGSASFVSGGDTDFHYLGGRNSLSSDGDIAQIVVFPAALSAPLRRRIQDSAALSFKIPCN